MSGTRSNPGGLTTEQNTENDNLIITGLPRGYYTENTKVYVTDQQLQTALDIKPEKIIEGQTIGGIAGVVEVKGIDTSDATATASDILSGKTAYVDGNKITGTIEVSNYAHATSMTEGETDYGFCGFPDGYYQKKDDVDFPTPQAQLSKDIVRTYLGVFPDRIVKGQTIAGIEGTAETGGGIDTSDATATADDILASKTAYVDGTKITGTMVNQSAETAGLGWDFLTETISPGQSPSYGRAMFVAIPKGAYIGEFSKSGWEGPAGPVIRVPSKTQTITPSEYEQTVSTTTKVIEKVTIKPIPSSYKNTSDANATSNELLENHSAYVKGEKIIGAIPNMNIVDSTIGGINADYPGVAIHKGGSGQFGRTTTSNELLFAVAPQKGYYSGQSYVGYPAKDVSVTPSTTSQSVYPDYGEVLRSVTVASIPSSYMNVVENKQNLGNFAFGAESPSYTLPSKTGRKGAVIRLQADGIFDIDLYVSSVRYKGLIGYNGYEYSYNYNNSSGIFSLSLTGGTGNTTPMLVSLVYDLL